MSGFRLKVRVSSVALRRVDGTEEDDFKTWAHVLVVGAEEVWYPESAEPSVSNLGKTSVGVHPHTLRARQGGWVAGRYRGD
jgi:hypothetical protein